MNEVQNDESLFFKNFMSSTWLEKPETNHFMKKDRLEKIISKSISPTDPLVEKKIVEKVIFFVHKITWLEYLKMNKNREYENIMRLRIENNVLENNNVFRG